MKPPSKAVAAEYLRTLAERTHLPVGNPVTLAADLRMIADCIDGKVRWKKGGKRSFSERRKIGKAAWWVEHRPSNVTVKAALSDQVNALAEALGETTEAEKRILRGEIEALRKLQRKQTDANSEI